MSTEFTLPFEGLLLRVSVTREYDGLHGEVTGYEIEDGEAADEFGRGLLRGDEPEEDIEDGLELFEDACALVRCAGGDRDYAFVCDAEGGES